jgi:anthranilate synthase component II
MSNKILIIDNYDSFTFNLYQYIGEILLDSNSTIHVFRNDQVSFDQIKAANYDKIIVGPGPGSPDDPKYFGVCSQVILELGQNTPILGICLGMQGICHLFGGKVVRAKNPMHGKTSLLTHNSKGIFENLPQNLEVMRYHSLVCEDIPDCLEVLATAQDDGSVMALRHKAFPIVGVQFHPESFATEGGKQLLENWISQ